MGQGSSGRRAREEDSPKEVTQLANTKRKGSLEKGCEKDSGISGKAAQGPAGRRMREGPVGAGCLEPICPPLSLDPRQ